MKRYDHKKIEQKWQTEWEKNRLYQVDLDDNQKPKFYNLVMFPYPSGEYLHIGHAYNFSGADVFGRYLRLKGFNVFEPIGYDSFGLPAENYALKLGGHPQEIINKNIKIARNQLKTFGCIFDFSKEIITSEPSYYRWTQWLFIKLYQQGLAYQKDSPVNWCPRCQTVLANEQVIDGFCERCESGVVQKKLKQWFFKISDYADRLIDDLDKVDWPESSKIKQRNWIGRSEGVEFEMEIDGVRGKKIGVFTTRIDTVYGMTYVVLSPEHSLVSSIATENYKKDIKDYQLKAQRLSEVERQSAEKEKTGVFTGAFAINPFNNQKVPIWIADYILSSYGTGAVMAVPAHDERDYDFAKKYNLEIIKSIKPESGKAVTRVFTDKGVLISSEKYNGLSSQDAVEKMTIWLKEKKIGGKKVTYRLRDWSFSRQRYWGTPIPVIYCAKCGTITVPEKDLPVELPKIDDFKPTGLGKGPLAKNESFVQTVCPKCGGMAERETDTMDTFVDSSFYFLRYPSADNETELMNKKFVQKWLPVDMYIGGAEHVTMHLLYARFVTKALFDAGLISFDEPFSKLRHQGMILGTDGKKMSKSKGNAVIPDQVISKSGADALRTYILFMGQYEEGGPWNPNGLHGIERFIEKIWRLFDKKIVATEEDKELAKLLHKTIRKISDDIEEFKFNTAISSLMILVNLIATRETVRKETLEALSILSSPFMPHLAEELWQKLGKGGSIFDATWPDYDKKLIKDDTVTIAIQINGKIRDQVTVVPKSSQETVLQLAQERSKVQKYLTGQKIEKVFYIPDRILSIVTEE